MSQQILNGKEAAPKPPAISYKTLKNFLDNFKTSDIPSHIDRSVMPASMSGGNQVYVLSALKFLGLVSDNGIPNESFNKLVKSEGEERATLLHEVLKSSYGFLLNDIDIERATTRVVSERFKDTGMSGDTIRKAIVFFQFAAKDAGMKVSSHIKPYNQVSRTKLPKQRKAVERIEDDQQEDFDETSRHEAPPQAQSHYQVLINILSPDMEEEEQNAVWTLIRYLKNKEV